MRNHDRNRELRRYVGPEIAIWTAIVAGVWVALAFWGGTDDCGDYSILCLSNGAMLGLLALPAILIWILGIAVIVGSWR